MTKKNVKDPLRVTWRMRCVPWLIHVCAMTHSYVRHVSVICVSWLIDMCAWLIHMCAMTHSYVCHDSFICVPWLIDTCAMTHSYVHRDSLICVTWLIPLAAQWLHCSACVRHSCRHERFFLVRFHCGVLHDIRVCGMKWKNSRTKRMQDGGINKWFLPVRVEAIASEMRAAHDTCIYTYVNMYSCLYIYVEWIYICIWSYVYMIIWFYVHTYIYIYTYRVTLCILASSDEQKAWHRSDLSGFVKLHCLCMCPLLRAICVFDYRCPLRFLYRLQRRRWRRFARLRMKSFTAMYIFFSYIYIYIYLYVYIYTHMYAYIHIGNRSACLSVFSVEVGGGGVPRSCERSYSRRCTLLYVYIFLYVSICIHIGVYIYIYIQPLSIIFFV